MTGRFRNFNFKTMQKEKIKKYAENTAVFGMLLLTAALAIPIANLGGEGVMSPCKWPFAAGALIYIVARIVAAGDKTESPRMRRLRRMQFWGGIAFGVAAFFWFYNEERLGTSAGPLTIINKTILFALVGAMIQLISSWMIWSQQKKEANDSASESNERK